MMRTIASRQKRSDNVASRNSIPVCKERCFHPEAVKRAERSMPSEKEIDDLATLYSALASPVRLKIICALEKVDLCVCDIAHILGLSIPATSHQLKYLYERKLLTFRNEGKMVYYSLNRKGELPTILTIKKHVKPQKEE